MRIKFSPQRRDDKLVMSKAGDVLIINGDEYDFSVIPDGATLLEVPGDFVCGSVKRVNGEIEITVLLPHGPNPPPSVAFPHAVNVTSDGPVKVPEHFYHEVVDDDQD